MNKMAFETKLREREALCLAPWSDLEESLVAGLIRLRNTQPQAVFCTQTSGVTYGLVLKEAYRTKFPEREQPKFLTIDVKQPRDVLNRMGVNPFEITAKYLMRDVVAMNTFSEALHYDLDEHIRNIMDNLLEFSEVVEGLKKKIELYDLKGKIMVLDEFASRGLTLGVAKYAVVKAFAELGIPESTVAYNLKDLALEQGGPFIEEIKVVEDTKKGSVRRAKLCSKDQNEIALKNVRALQKLGRMIGEKLR